MMDQPSFLRDYCEYQAYKAAKDRCSNPNSPRYADYGGRGIRMAPEWSCRGGFLAFITHVGRRPSPQHQIDRIDNDKGYEPGNVRWALSAEQNNNRRDNRLVTAYGRTMNVTQWSHETGVTRGTIISRLGRGMSSEEAVSSPPKEIMAAKLSPAEVIQLREMRKTGASYRTIGKRFGVNAQTAWRAVNGEAWRHV